MKKRVLRKLTITIVKRFARFASFFLKPITIFKWTGILPVRIISYKDLAPVSYRDQGVFPSEKPRSIRGNDCWTATPTSPMVMGHFLELKDGIASGSGYVFDETGRLIVGASHRYSRKIKKRLVSHPYHLTPDIKKFNGVVAAVTASNQDAYFHWLFDLLPRLLMLEKAGTKPEKIYLQNRYRFQRETLELLGMARKEDIINCDEFPMLSASTLIVPCHEVMDGREFPDWVVAFVRDRFLTSAPKMGNTSQNRLFISRADALFRRVLNEDEILPILQEYGFVSVKLEELTFTEQVKLFRDAEAVVLPHGSGLANLVFCSKGTKVIELLPFLVLDHGFRLSTAVGLDYFFLNSREGDSMLCEGTSHSGNIPYDFKINPKDLVDTLQLAKIDKVHRGVVASPPLSIPQKLEQEYVQRRALGVK
jgi:glycosyl transferase family 61